jgi:uncharacterized LabA/DUF88 family protein
VVKKLPKTYAFIDSQNLNLGLKNDIANQEGRIIYRGQELDYRKFRHYLREKYNVSKAYLFIGMVPRYSKLYTHLQECGFTLIFKTISSYMNEHGHTITKGNVDTDIAIWSAGRLVQEYDKAVFVSGDGDFVSLYAYIDELGKLEKIMVPNRMRYSKLLNEYHEKLLFVSDLQQLLSPRSIPFKKQMTQKKTRSSGRITSLGQPGHGDRSIVAKKARTVNKSEGAKG